MVQLVTKKTVIKIVQAYDLANHILITAVYVIQILIMIAFRIVMELGEGMQLLKYSTMIQMVMG